MKIVYSVVVALTLLTGAAAGGQPNQGDTIVVSPTVTQSVKEVQWRRYRYSPYYGYGWGGYYPMYRSYYSYRPYWDGRAFYYGPRGFYFRW